MNTRKYISDHEAKKLICDIGKKMYFRGFVAANDGNITVRVGDNAVWATPTGVSKGDLKPEMLIKVDLEGNVLEGTWEPTSETHMHLRAYKENDEIVSTCHTHSIYAMVFACAGIELDVAFSPEPTGVVGTVPVAPYACPGTQELADSIAPFCNTHKLCLLANHGALSWGTSPEQAWFRMEALEQYCKLALIQECVVGRARKLSEEQIEKLLIRHNTGVKESNKLKGVEKTNNTEPAIKLSTISQTRGHNSLGQSYSEEMIELLADKVSDKIIKKMNA